MPNRDEKPAPFPIEGLGVESEPEVPQEPAVHMRSNRSYRQELADLAIHTEDLLIFSDYVNQWRAIEGTLSFGSFLKERKLPPKRLQKAIDEVEFLSKRLLTATDLTDKDNRSLRPAISRRDIAEHRRLNPGQERVAKRKDEVLPYGELWADIGKLFASIIEAAKFSEYPEDIGRYVRRQNADIASKSHWFEHRTPLNASDYDWSMEDEADDWNEEEGAYAREHEMPGPDDFDDQME